MGLPSIEEALARAEAAVEAGEGLSGTGFWGAVSEVKRSPQLVERYAERIASIDARAFDSWVLVKIPLAFGTTIAVIATLAGLGLVGWSYYLDDLQAVVAFGIGVGVLLGSTHGLAHLVVGWLSGMRFTCWFVGEISRPQPGVKIDYSTYLRTPARRRAWMHASGALTTKAIPFLMVPAAIAAGMPAWVSWLLVGVGATTIATDILWSTEKSDWKKFSREMRFAQES